jgi:hypothetical protein
MPSDRHEAFPSCSFDFVALGASCLWLLDGYIPRLVVLF